MAAQVEKPRIYLAGPGVFRPDAKAFGRSLQEKCERLGLEGCFPLDNEVSGTSARETAEAIYRANVDLINSSRAIIADISPFRGPNMDPGTAWEIGYGVARGLPVFAWSSDMTDLLERTQQSAYRAQSNRRVDQNGWTIENFGLVENLMIAISSTTIYADENAAILACAAAIEQGKI